MSESVEDMDDKSGEFTKEGEVLGAGTGELGFRKTETGTGMRLTVT